MGETLFQLVCKVSASCAVLKMLRLLARTTPFLAAGGGALIFFDVNHGNAPGHAPSVAACAAKPSTVFGDIGLGKFCTADGGITPLAPSTIRSTSTRLQTTTAAVAVIITG